MRINFSSLTRVPASRGRLLLRGDRGTRRGGESRERRDDDGIVDGPARALPFSIRQNSKREAGNLLKFRWDRGFCARSLSDSEKGGSFEAEGESLRDHGLGVLWRWTWPRSH